MLWGLWPFHKALEQKRKKKGMNIVREEPPLLPAGRWDHTIGTSTEKPFELKLYNDVTK